MEDKIFEESVSFQLPYLDIVEPLLDAIWRALIIELGANREAEVASDKRLWKCFWQHEALVCQFDQWLTSKRNLHLTNGWRSPKGVDAPIISDLADDSFRCIRLVRLNANRMRIEAAKQSTTTTIRLPSPFRILADFLAIPEEPASRAYALAAIKTYLQFKLLVRPGRQEGLTIGHLKETWRKLCGKSENPVLSDEDIFTCLLLSADGLLDIIVKRETIDKQDFTNLFNVRSVIQGGRLAGASAFEKSSEYFVIPNVSEIANRVLGLSLPIRGADTILFGGLRLSQDGGLVAAVNGEPGTGKTSFGLALASVLAPLGTMTFFITAEEQAAALEGRLLELQPGYLASTSLALANEKDWFHVLHLPSLELTKRWEQLDSVLGSLKRVRDDVEGQRATPAVGVPCRALIVLDGLQNFLVNGFAGVEAGVTGFNLAQFVKKCSSLGAIVIVTMAKGQESLKPLEYLVDIILDFEYRNTNSAGEKPVRHLVLRKTRLQLSRPGTHICHLSGGDGFRIAPQLPSQLDRRTNLQVLRPDEHRFIGILNLPHNGYPVTKSAFFRLDEFDLRVFRRSHILVSGRGSTGKAGFGLSLAAAPLLNNKDQSAQWGGRVLVISFLYPDEYYLNLRDSVFSTLAEQHNVPLEQSPGIKVLYFFPGFLNPEDLFSRISRHLDAGELEGNPYTAVLIDGLHNTFLQFPRLAANSMVWPMLYGMLRTRDLTVVTTHTSFSIDHGNHDINELPIEGEKPLLHALVQATDFHFCIYRREDKSTPTQSNISKKGQRKDLIIDIRTALGQNIGNFELFWSRERNTIWVKVRDLRQSDLPL